MTAITPPLKAPLPYFGGKSRAAGIIWERFGNVGNFVEPFAGSLAVLLARPHEPGTETVNDLDGLLSNMWRALRLDPDAVAYYADAPVVEVDLHAKHIALVNARDTLTARLMADSDYYDAKLAGYYLWGACNWIGSGWCSGTGPWVVRDGMLVNSRADGDAGVGVSRKLPHLGDAGVGVSRQLPHLGDADVGEENPGLYQWMRDLSRRLRRVRIVCGSWDRIVGPSVTTKHGLTAVFLDPPYNAEGADNDVYGLAHDASVSAAARAWATENGDNPLLRICLAGYADEHEMPPGWEAVPWKARRGYQRVKADNSHNGHREMLWFSPHCLKPRAAPASLFSLEAP